MISTAPQNYTCVIHTFYKVQKSRFLWLESQVIVGICGQEACKNNDMLTGVEAVRIYSGYSMMRTDDLLD